MSSTWGNAIKISLFGEAHGKYVGGTMHDFPAGVELNMDRIKLALKLRQGSNNFSHARKEEDRPKILSGITDGVTNGAPITVVFANKDVNVDDRCEDNSPRPSSADYVAEVRYNGAADMTGGGHFAGRLTLPLVFFGMMCADYLSKKGVEIVSHIKKIGDTRDERFPMQISKALVDRLNSSPLATISPEARKRMVSLLEGVKAMGDSIGGAVETAVIGMPAGFGSPIFDNVESKLAGIVYSIPAVKSVSFGHGYDFAKSRGSEVNDAFIMEAGNVRTATNFNGGLNGGITNGMPILMTTVFKPTPSIKQPQYTLDIAQNKMINLEVKGEHVCCLAPRGSIIVTSAVAIGMMDLYLEGTGYRG